MLTQGNNVPGLVILKTNRMHCEELRVGHLPVWRAVVAPRILQSAHRSILGKNTEPRVTPVHALECEHVV